MNNSLVIIDDNDDVLDSISDYLNLKGFDIVGSGHNGLEAVELYKEYKPDIVILDLAMPKYDGFYGLKHISKINSHAKVIVFSGVFEEITEEQIKTSDETKIIEKPCTQKQLERVLKTITSMLENTAPNYNIQV